MVLESLGQEHIRESKKGKESALIVGIPVRNKRELTMTLVGQLANQDEYSHIYIYDNGSTDDTREAVESSDIRDLSLMGASKLSIYEMWNHMIMMAEVQEENVAILNNDILIGPNFLSRLDEPLGGDIWITYPDYDRSLKQGYRFTRGTYRQGGMSGFAFAVKHDIPVRVDTRFKWWYGDDDLAHKTVKRGGKICRVSGCHVHHLGSMTAKHHPEVRKQISQDKELWRSLGRS